MDVTEVRINLKYYFSLTSQCKHEQQSLCRGYNGRQIRHTMIGFISVFELDNFTLSSLMTTTVRLSHLRNDTILPVFNHILVTGFTYALLFNLHLIKIYYYSLGKFTFTAFFLLNTPRKYTLVRCVFLSTDHKRQMFVEFLLLLKYMKF